MNDPMKRTLRLSLAAAVLLCAGGAMADEVRKYADGIAISRIADADVITLTITGPDDYQFSSPTGSGTDTYSLAELGITRDGLYRYQVRQYSYMKAPASGSRELDGMRTPRKVTRVGTSSGHIRVFNGAIVLASDRPKEESQ